MINAGFTTVQIGNFTSKIALYKPVQIKNERGAVENDYQKIKEVYASVEQKPSSDATVDNNMSTVNNIEVKLYIERELTAAWRIEYNGQMYNITSFNKLDRQPAMIVQATQLLE